jgi:hypothetical protein
MKKAPGIFFTLAFLAMIMPAVGRSESPLDYRPDGVVVKGKQVTDMLNEKISNLSLMRWNGKSFEPIPFQVDEKTPDGGFIYQYGPKKNPELGNGKLDNQDELVFMAFDAAAPAPESAKSLAGAVKGEEIVIANSQNGDKAAVYLFSFSANPPRSQTDYVQHVVEGGRNWVKTDHYWFGEPQAKGFFDRFHLVQQDGKMGPNTVDRIKGRGHISTLGGMVNMVKGEQDTPADLIAWIDGPVRVVHRMEGGVELLGLKLKLAGGSDNVFYRTYLYTPIFFSLPPGAGALLKGSYMIYTIDFNQSYKGSYYFDVTTKTPTTLDGKMDATEKNLDKKTSHTWYAVGGDKGSMVVRMIVPDQWKGVVTETTYYEDSDTDQDPPESEPGRHQVGFTLGGMFEAPAGKYSYYLYYMVPEKKVTQENIGPWLDVVDHPLKISGKALTAK